MAKKKTVEKPPREYSRRQLSQWQRQRKRQRLITTIGISIIAVVIFIVIVGWYIGEYRPVHQAVIKVNDTEFNMQYYIDVVKIAARNQPTDSTQSPTEYVWDLTDSVVREIEQNELIRQGALILGFSVSNDEAREALEGSDIPINDASLDLIRSQILRSKLYREYFEPQVPKSMEQVKMMAMLLESESQAAKIRDRLQSSENFSALAEEYSLNNYTKINKGEIGWHPEEIITGRLGSSVPAEYAFGSEAGALSQPRYDESVSKPVGYWLVNVLDKQYQDEAQVQAMLLSSEEEAKDIRVRLEAGEDLQTLAEEYSQYEESKKQGGELGLVSEKEMNPAVDGYIFNQEVEIGVWSEPILDDMAWTTGGYWLVKVVDKDDNRELDDNDRNYLIATDFNEWVSLLWIDPNNVVDDSYLDEEAMVWAVERVIKG